MESPERIAHFREMNQELPLSPEPVITRWGTWLSVAMYYAENFEKMYSVLSLNTEKATCIGKAQKVVRRKHLLADLQYIQTNFECLVEYINKLQTQGLSLQESLISTRKG